MVLEFERCRTGTALGPVHGDEVRGGPDLQHRLAQGEHLHPAADAELDADRFAARQLPQMGQELDELDRGREHRMGWGRHAFLALGNTAEDRKSTRLNSSHVASSYAVFCLKKKAHAATHCG